MARLQTTDFQEIFDACLRRDWSGALEAIATVRTTSEAAASSLLLQQLSIYVSSHQLQQGDQARGLYDSGKAFARFIEGFGNEPLYADCTRAMARLYHETLEHQQQQQPSSRLAVLDIGVGNGRALVPALEQLGTSVTLELDIIDPSNELLSECTTKLEQARQASHFPTIERLESSITTIQQYLDTQTTRRWSVVQSTFALHNLAPSERLRVFRQLHSRTETVFVIEFDTYSQPPRADSTLEPIGKAEKLDYTLERYERALQLYQHEPNYELVVQGFLLPIMLGYFDASAPTATFEQPLQAWVEEFRLAGTCYYHHHHHHHHYYY